MQAVSCSKARVSAGEKRMISLFLQKFVGHAGAELLRLQSQLHPGHQICREGYDKYRLKGNFLLSVQKQLSAEFQRSRVSLTLFFFEFRN